MPGTGAVTFAGCRMEKSRLPIGPGAAVATALVEEAEVLEGLGGVVAVVICATVAAGRVVCIVGGGGGGCRTGAGAGAGGGVGCGGL